MNDKLKGKIISNKEEAHERMTQLINWFQRDLAYTAPELYYEKWERFKAMMAEFVEEVYSD